MDILKRNERIRALAPREESLILILGGIGFLFCVGAAFSGRANLSGNTAGWSEFLAQGLFLGVVHTGFTLYMILFLPEIHSTLFKCSALRRGTLAAKAIIAFIGMVLVTRFLILDSGTIGSYPRIGFVVLAITQFLVYHHTIKQVSGISLIYNHQAIPFIREDSQATRRQVGCERREKLLFGLLLIAGGIGTLPSFQPARLAWLAYGILVGLILWNSMLYPYARNSNKTFFLSRLFYYAINPYCNVAGFFISANHGTEYAAICRKMSVASKRPGPIWALALISLLVLALLITNPATGLGWLLMPRFPSRVGLLKWMTSLSVGITFLHYYLDRELFRMKDPLIREGVGPLFSRISN